MAAALVALGMVIAMSGVAIAAARAHRDHAGHRHLAEADRAQRLGTPRPPKPTQPPSSAYVFSLLSPPVTAAQASSPAASATQPATKPPAAQSSATLPSPSSSTTPPPTTAPSSQASATPSSPAAVMPDGIPASDVGPLVVSDSAADLWNTWDYTSIPEGADCETFGTVALGADGDLDLTTNGQFGNCGKITSVGTYGYGIYEARIWVQAGPNGTIANWPAFYLSGPDWPVGGEIDAFEAMGGYDAASFHYGADDSTLTKKDPALKAGWNIVDVIWQPERLAIYYNGQQFVAWDSSVITSQPMWITFDTTTGVDGYTTGQPSSMYVDYLRIWQLG
jgi:hypothetical protein